jgi:DNA repair protein RadC
MVLYLNNSNRTVSHSIASIGGLTDTLVAIGLVLRGALLTQSTSVILVHNHPSGNLEPSQSDLSFTDKVKKAAELMDIKLLDHLMTS